MKIAVKDLKPNPYRNMDRYPIDRAKVEQLKSSIKDLTFWDNILLRKNCQGYEIAYGHHRWIALKELKYKEIDVPVRQLDDATMIRIMAEENFNWQSSPAVINETVLAVKTFLDAEIAKYDDWSHVNKSIKVIFASNSQFQQCKQDGVGQTTILKFLGGNWKQHTIQSALLTLKLDKMPASQGGVDRNATEIIPTMEQAKVFRNSVSEHKIPKPTQKKIAKEIVSEGVGKRDIPYLVAEHSTLPVKKRCEPKKIPSLIEFLNKREAEVDKLNYHLTALKPELKELVKSPRTLGRLVSTLKRLSNTMESIIAEYETQTMRKESEICVK